MSLYPPGMESLEKSPFKYEGDGVYRAKLQLMDDGCGAQWLELNFIVGSDENEYEFSIFLVTQAGMKRRQISHVGVHDAEILTNALYGVAQLRQITVIEPK